MFSSEPKPNCVATTLRDTVWSSSASRAASTRTCSTYCAGDFPISDLKTRGKVALGHVAARRHRWHRIGVSGPFLDGGQQGVEPAGRAVELVAQAGAELALPALALDRQNQRSRDAERFGAAKVFFDECKRHVDARGDAGGCPDGTILHEDLVTRHRDAGIFLRKAMAFGPMRRGTLSGQESCLGQDERPEAHRTYASRSRRRLHQKRCQVGRIARFERTATTGHDQRVRRGRVGRMHRHQRQHRVRRHRFTVHRDDADPVGRGSVAAPGIGKDLKGSGHIQQIHVVVGRSGKPEMVCEDWPNLLA